MTERPRRTVLNPGLDINFPRDRIILLRHGGSTTGDRGSSYSAINGARVSAGPGATYFNGDSNDDDDFGASDVEPEHEFAYFVISVDVSHFGYF